MPTLNDLLCYRGQDIVYPFAMSPAQSIAGRTIRMGVKRKSSDADFLLTKDATPVDETQGIFQVAVAADDTLDLDIAIYSYGVWFDDDGAHTPISVGSFKVMWGTLY